MFPKEVVIWLLGMFTLCVVRANANTTRYLAELPQEEAEVVRYEIEKLSVAGLDTAPAIAKVQEGLAKNIPPEKITLAVKQEVSMRIRASRMATEAGLKPDKELVNALALAMRRGAQEKDLAIALRSGGKLADIVQKVDQVGLMAQRGITGEKALEIVLRGILPTDPQDITQKNMLYQQNIRRAKSERLVPTNPSSTGDGSPKIEWANREIIVIR